MSKQTLKFGNIKVDKNEFHASKKVLTFNLVKTNKIVISEKIKHSDKSAKYFIGYEKDDIINFLCIVLPQMNECLKYFHNEGKSMSFEIDDDGVLVKYNNTQNKAKEKLAIEFHNNFTYDEEQIKTKVKAINSVVDTAFSNDRLPKESIAQQQ